MLECLQGSPPCPCVKNGIKLETFIEDQPSLETRDDQNFDFVIMVKWAIWIELVDYTFKPFSFD